MKTGSEDLPIIAITLGDPAGIGPEIVVKALVNKEILKVCRPVVIGSPLVIEQNIRDLRKTIRVDTINKLTDAYPTEEHINCFSVETPEFQLNERGQILSKGGLAAYMYIETAAKLCISGAAAALVTSPINKESISAAGKQGGHTEILAEICNARNVAMLLTSNKLRISHATTHVALRDVPSKLTSERILRVIELTDDFLKKMRIKRPKIGVLALNPHAGEHGLFGMEEEQVIAPAVSEAKKNGMQVFGPLPADSAVYYAIQGNYDALVAMYHDQGHIPIKLLGFYDGVNVTLGLPIIRTSVDHGTAFDIVGQNIANPSSLIAAIKLAADLASSKDIPYVNSTNFA